MIANEADAERVHEITPEEAGLLEKSRAPTLRDLHMTATDLITMLALEQDSRTTDQAQTAN
jgi:hypothetical protein